MIELPFMDRFPDESIEKGIKILDRVYWFIQVNQKNTLWSVYAGEELIFKTDSKEALDAFLYGLAITYVSIPDALVDSISDLVKKWVD